MTQKWFVYIILADDNSLYTGITTNLLSRFNAHLCKKGAKYFFSRKPLKIVFSEVHPNRSSASKREIQIKKMPRKDKLDIIKQAKKKLD